MAWRTLSGAVRGTSHVRSGAPCQDAVSVRTIGDLLVAALSDGAGSAALSQISASIVAEAAARFFITRAENGREIEPHAAFGELLSAVGARIQAEAAFSDRNLADYHATMLCAVVVPDGGLLAAQVGDGFICGRRWGSRAYETVCAAAKGEYSNQTVFVTLASAPEYLSVAWMPGEWEFVCLSSDGLEPIAIERRSRQPGQAFFRRLEDDIRRHPDYKDGALLEWLGSDAVNHRCDDDKSMVVAFNGEA